MPSPLGPDEGAALVAVERANGGELAPLPQVLWTMDGFTPPGSRPSPAGFAASATLLIRLGVVEYLDDQLGLTPEGRKLLRRSGMPNDPRHVAIVTELVQEFEAADLRPDGSVPAPTEADVHAALSDEKQIEETADGAGMPITEMEDPNYAPILGLGSPGLVTGTYWVPSVPPGGSDEPTPKVTEPAEPEEPTDGPEHPFLDRLFGHHRDHDTEPDQS